MEYLNRCGKNNYESLQQLIFELKLINEGYMGDSDPQYYEQVEHAKVLYIFNNNKYELKKYKDCDYYGYLLRNTKKKKYRLILLSDFINQKDYDLCFFNNELCFNYNNDLIFFNSNMILPNAGILLVDQLKKYNHDELMKLYFDKKDNHYISKKSVSGYTVFDDDYIDNQIRRYYEKLLTEHCKYVSEAYRKICDDIDKETDKETKKPLFNYGDNGRFIEIQLLRINNNPIKNEFCDNFIDIDSIIKELRKKHVWKNLKNNMWIDYEFRNKMRQSDDYVQGEDFTFLILNLIKAIEYFLYDKLRNSYQKADDNIDEKIMFKDMIDKINLNMIRPELKDKFDDKQLELFKQELRYVKDECRNGYFHKERIDSYDSLMEKRNKAFKVLIEIAILLK